MKCPFCGDPNTQVTDTRENEEGDVVRRRRRCIACDKRFTTYERIDLKMPTIIKRNGARVEFEHDKLAASLRLALRKRPVSPNDVVQAIERIERQLLAHGSPEIASEKVGELVMNELKRLDKVAYVRFASVYRNFAAVDEFSDLIREVQQPRPRRRREPPAPPPASTGNDLFSN